MWPSWPKLQRRVEKGKEKLRSQCRGRCVELFRVRAEKSEIENEDLVLVRDAISYPLNLKANNVLILNAPIYKTKLLILHSKILLIHLMIY